MRREMLHEHQEHHRRSVRLPAWNYREQGAYFVTICTHERACFLDDPDIEFWATKTWARSVCGGRLPRLYEFVAMPNHVHGIIWITSAGVGARHPCARNDVSAPGRQSISESPGAIMGASPLQASRCAPGSVGALVGAFKSSLAKRINNMRGTPGALVWQRSYYERVIRDERELEQAWEYILDNPRRWVEDEYNPAHDRQCPDADPCPTRFFVPQNDRGLPQTPLTGHNSRDG